MRVLAVVGVSILGKGIWLIVRARRFLRVAEQVPGLVSAHRHRVRRTSDGDRITTVPVLRFRTPTGQLVEAEQSISLRRQVPDPDSEADVLYDRSARSAAAAAMPQQPVKRQVAGISAGPPSLSIVCNCGVGVVRAEVSISCVRTSGPGPSVGGAVEVVGDGGAGRPGWLRLPMESGGKDGV